MKEKHVLKSNSNVVSFIPDGEFYYNKALVALDRDQLNKAYKYIKRAAELSPDNAQILLQYGILEMESGQFEHAYELIHTAHSLEPDEAEIVYVLAEASGSMGIMGEAIKYANKYLEMEPDGAYVEDALEIIDFIGEQNLPEEQPTDDLESEKFILQEKARRFMEAGQFEQAIEVLEQVIEQHPALWAAYNNLALAYFYIGEKEQAFALLHQTLNENKGNLHALCNLAVFYYYEKQYDSLEPLTAMLNKIQPYEMDDRYKLGATLGLIGEHETAYKWLYSMKKRGYEGNAGFYFWLANSAFAIGKQSIAESSWHALVNLDPSKEGYEPWGELAGEAKLKSIENNRDFLVHKITSEYTEDRLFGFFLLKNSMHKQEIIAHPKWIDVAVYNEIEKLSLAYALGHEFNDKVAEEKRFLLLMETAQLVEKRFGEVNVEAMKLLHIWFALSSKAIEAGYTFKNPKALAAALEYSYLSALEEKVTKKEIAQLYDTSVATLTKYMDELYEFIPTED